MKRIEYDHAHKDTLSDSEIFKCLIFGYFKCYRKWRGGFWTKVHSPALIGYYWIRRKPYSFELKIKDVIETEEYTK